MRSILDLPHLGDDPNEPFPPTSLALESPNGLLAWGGGLEPERLISAYESGIFPWYTEGQPVLWWSPAPRCVLFPEKVYLSRRTRRRHNSGRYRFTADSAFAVVMESCAQPRINESGTWITPAMKDAYTELHELGYAHSIEVWLDGELAGGIYGLALGSVFFGESMFSHQADASKLALVALCRILQKWQYGMLDCQVGNPHLFRMGAQEISRVEFEQRLETLTREPRPALTWRNRVEFERRW